MDLFENFPDSKENLLPKDGTVNYYGRIFSEEECTRFFEILLHEIEWKQDEVFIFGKKILTKRKAAWYGDKKFNYTYSKSTKTAIIWTDTLLKIKSIVEATSGQTYNSCLLNIYHNGEECMAYHSDNEPEMKKNGAIASVSFGAERKFSFKHKLSKERIDLFLENGSILVMKGQTQDFWLHQLPPSKKISTARINLTFRTIENYKP